MNIIEMFDNDGILQHSLGGVEVFISLQHIIAPALDLMPRLPSRQRREARKTLNSKRKHEIIAMKQRFLP